MGKLKHSRVPVYRRNIGSYFRDYRLLPDLQSLKNIAFALEVIGHGKGGYPPPCAEVLELVSLEDKAVFPNELPRTAAKGDNRSAIANHPKVLIADEPTGNLDPDKSGGNHGVAGENQ